MPILGVQVDNIGQSGQLPKFIYINTNDTISQVTTVGYLNHVIAQGQPISDSDMALVTTKLTPNASMVEPILCSVSLTSGNWSLSQYNPSGGFSPANDYSIASSDPITGNWDFLGAFSVYAGNGNVTLESSTGQINVLATNPGQPVNIIASNVSILGSNQVGISSSTQVYLSSGGMLSLASVGGDIMLAASGNIIFTELPNVVTGNALYYDPISGDVTYGAAGGGGGSGFTWNSVPGTSQTLVATNAYVSNNSALTTFSLPISAAVGDEFRIVGQGTGGWTIAQNAGQNIQIGALSSTVGVSGSVSSTNQFDSIWLVCITANSVFSATPAPVGNLTIV